MANNLGAVCADTPCEQTMLMTRFTKTVSWMIPFLLLVAVLLASWQVAHRLVALEIHRSSPEREGLNEAIAWDPSNPDFYYRRGLTLQDELVDERTGAEGDFRRAVILNPYYWRYWFALAGEYELQGRLQEAEAAYLRTVALSPNNGFYEWSLANFYLRTGDIFRFLEHLEISLPLRPEYRKSAFELALKVGVSAQELDGAWPQDQESLVLLLTSLIDRADRAEQLWGSDLIDRLWEKVLSGPAPVAGGVADRYMQHLLESRRTRQARRAWIQFQKRKGISSRPFESKKNYVWNGDFELPHSFSCLDWEINETPAFSYNSVSVSNPGSTQTLRLVFQGENNPDFRNLAQRVIVDPGQTYQFSFRARSVEITSDQGLFFEISQPENEPLGRTEPIRGTTSWKTYSVQFRLPDDTEVIRITLRRNPSRRIDRLLLGTLWIDEVEIKRIETGNTTGGSPIDALPPSLSRSDVATQPFFGRSERSSGLPGL